VEPTENLARLLDPGRSVPASLPGLLAPGPAGVRFLAGASGVARLAGLHRGELRRLVHRLEPCVQGSDMVVIDLSSGISPSTRLFLQAAMEVVIVANPEPSAMLDAYGVIKLLAELGHSGLLHLVMNRARDPSFAEDCAGRILSTAQRFLGRGVEFLGSVPEDPAVIDSVQQRRPLVLLRPDSPAAVALGTLGESLFRDAAPLTDTLSGFFATAKGLVAPRPRSTESSCALS
jgi:flagellar biosynthesis protein FlhG